MNNILQTLFAHPLLGPALPVIGATVPLTMLLAFAGSGFMIGSLQVAGAISKRSSYDKAARQMASVALVIGWLLLVGSRVWLFFSSDSYVPASMVANIVELSWCIFGFAVIALSVHFAVWRFLAAHRICHSLLAFLSGINGVAGCAAILGSLRVLMALELPNADKISLPDLFNFQLFPSSLWYAGAMILPLALALPASFGLVWLLLRRRRDDFGRDYYTKTMKWVSLWGAIAWIPVIVLTGAIVFLEIESVLRSGAQLTPSMLLLHGCRLLPSLLTCIFLIVIRCSSLPMRLKPLVWTALLTSMPAAWYVFEDTTTFVF